MNIRTTIADLTGLLDTLRTATKPEPSVFLCKSSRDYKVVLLGGEYYECNDKEYRRLLLGRTPDDLDLLPLAEYPCGGDDD